MNDHRSKCFGFLSRNALIISVLIGVVVGFAFGFGLRSVEPSSDALTWIGLPGEIFMRLLKMLILPLIVASIITGTASMNARTNGRLGAVSFCYILVTVAIGAVIAIILFLVFQPGKDVDLSASTNSYTVKRDIETTDMFADMIRNFFPDNVVTACFQKTQTKYLQVSRTVALNGTNITITAVQKVLSSTSGLNILGLIVACLMFGVTASNLEDRAEPFITFFDTIAVILIRLLNWIIWLTPVGVASLITTALLKVSDIESVFTSMGMFVLAHSVGIAFHQLVLIPFAYFITTRKNPLHFMGYCLRPCLSVFGPASVAVGLPDMLKTLDENLHVDRRISNFFVPVAVSIEKCGSCIFICLSALFLAQLEGMNMNASRVVIIGLLSTAGALAVPPVPSSSIVSVLVVLSSIDIQVHNVGLLMALEWYNDRIRTTSNATTTVLGAVMVERLCKTRLNSEQEMDSYKKTQERPLYDSEIRVLVNKDKALGD
ncbi:excitatory amino acid transporter-like [Crassostrea angulata]|uniref:excitatory amino acid transporter-like n=1 Tax=Magallana angulata TaxID=2784310 RepID=UPI0022B1F580|nr:excitatory amino acid transporter-like [Crassostrea angulata]